MQNENIYSGKEASELQWLFEFGGNSYNVTKHPLEIFTQLLALNLIEDINFDLNSNVIKDYLFNDFVFRTVVGASSCINHKYGARFNVSIFSVDCYAEIYVNNVLVFTNTNQFVPFNYFSDAANEPVELKIVLKSDHLYAKFLESKYGKYVCWNGDSSRMHLRKAQYQWGWDWGPEVMSRGIYGVKVHTYHAMITSTSISYDFMTEHLDKCIVSIGLDFDKAPSIDGLKFLVAITLRGNVVWRKLFAESEVSHIRFVIEHPEFWYPWTQGAQTQYKATITVIHPEFAHPLHSTCKYFGLRKIVLVEEEDLFGTSFYFNINGKDVFITGCNYIPPSLVPYSTTYKDTILKIKEAGMNCVRVWGGGYYEMTEFYEFCNNQGILVWQDFMFACGTYPANDEFLSSVKLEIRETLKRISGECCLLIFAGNNEDYAVAESGDFGYDPNNSNPDEWLTTKFPARYIYEIVIPNLLTEMSIRVPYKFGSPYSPHFQKSDSVVCGDIHQWNVWHGSQQPFQDYKVLGGRFVSEFGMISLPHNDTIANYKGKYIFDKYYSHHTKATGYELRLLKYISENYQFSTKPSSFRYISQVLQSDAVGCAYRSWRKEWCVRKCGGVLANDCWPCTSWSILDYYSRAKLSFYAIKRELAPFKLCTEDYGDVIRIWCVDDSNFYTNIDCVCEFIEYKTNNVLKKMFIKVPCNSYAFTDILKFPGEFVVCVVKVDTDDSMHGSRFHSELYSVVWPSLRDIPSLIRNVKILVHKKDVTESKFSVISDGLVKAVELSIDQEPNAWFSDNGFDMIGGIEYIVTVKGWKSGNLRALWYGSKDLEK